MPQNQIFLQFLICLLVTGVSSHSLFAHIVPRENHDRKILVKLGTHFPEKTRARMFASHIGLGSTSLLPGCSWPSFVGLGQISNRATIKVQVHYRLEVDELTAVMEDMAPFIDRIDFAAFRNKRTEFYKEYTRLYAPIFANNLLVRVNQKTLNLHGVKKGHFLQDEKGTPLGHLRCDFVFESQFPVESGQVYKFTFREGNFEEKIGLMVASLWANEGLKISNKKEAGPTLKTAPPTQWQPGDEETLRTVAADLAPPGFFWTLGMEKPLPIELVKVEKEHSNSAALKKPVDPTAEKKSSPSEKHDADSHSSGLFSLFMDTDYSIGVLLILSAVFGALHALTPGHGKTLVAAYLVGERGTAWHALVLGLVTTLTHTGVVLLIALGLLFIPESMDQELREALQFLLGLGMGLIVIGLGFWLLLCRLSGKADHVHWGGTGHHHHHNGQEAPQIDGKRYAGWWGIIVLGMSGGIVPCWDAVVMLFVAIGMGLFWLALPLLLSFSAGLAGVLIAIGLLVVYVRRFAQSKWRGGKLLRVLPLLSAVVIMAMGFWLCYESLYGGFH